MGKKRQTVAVIGATGAVGREVVRLLIERKFPFGNLRLFASEKSVGEELHGYRIEALENLEGIDLAFFCAGSKISREWIPKAKCLCIDSSSAFRAEAPLIIPEINAHAAKGKLLCSPNCTATVLLMPLFSLHRRFGVKRIIASTYQAASGGGRRLVEALENETRGYFEGKTDSKVAFNLYPHNSKLLENGYVEEELKMLFETRKILEDETIQMSATCVRVPVLRAHSVAANVEFRKPFSLEEVYQTLQNVSGVKIFEEREQNRFPTPHDATGKMDVFCGRFRIDPSQKNTLEFWAVGDQLLKGAALNAVQIAELVS